MTWTRVEAVVDRCATLTEDDCRALLSDRGEIPETRRQAEARAYRIAEARGLPAVEVWKRAFDATHQRLRWIAENTDDELLAFDLFWIGARDITHGVEWRCARAALAALVGDLEPDEHAALWGNFPAIARAV